MRGASDLINLFGGLYPSPSISMGEVWVKPPLSRFLWLPSVGSGSQCGRSGYPADHKNQLMAGRLCVGFRHFGEAGRT